MSSIREKIAWIVAGTLALGVVAALATAVSGGSLDPPGPPAPTGPLQAVMVPPGGRLIQVADDVLVPTSAVSLVEPTPTDTATPFVQPDTPTPIPSQTPPIGRMIEWVAFGQPTETVFPTSTYSPPTETPTPDVLPPPLAVSLGYHDVSDCAELSLLIDARAESGQVGDALLELRLQLSAVVDGRFGSLRFEDGSTAWKWNWVATDSPLQAQRSTQFGLLGQDAPLVGVFASVQPGATADLRLDAWLYCIPRV